MHHLLFLIAVGQANVAAPDVLAKETYLKAPAEIQRYFDAPRNQNYTLSNLNRDKSWFARLKSARGVNLADISTPYENLAGQFIDPRANRSRPLSYQTSHEIELTSANDFSKVVIAAPSGKWLSSLTWSPDGRYAMYLVHDADKSVVNVLDTSNMKPKELGAIPLLATQVVPVWSGDSRHIFAVAIPANRGPEPRFGAVPSQPKVQVTDSSSNKLRIYRSLLQNETDQAKFEYYNTGQLISIDVRTGKKVEIGKPAMISAVNPAPKGELARVTTIQKPFSYIVPASSFGRKEEIWDSTGASLFTLSNNRIRTGGEEIPQAGGNFARRGLAWMPDGSGLYFFRTEPAPGPAPTAAAPEDEQGRQGRPGAATEAPTGPRKESLIKWVAPFKKENESVLFTNERGLPSVTFSPDAKSIFFTETADSVSKTFKVSLDKPTERKQILSWKTGEGNPNPGSPVTEDNAFGEPTLDDSSGKILLRGSLPADKPKSIPARAFLDQLDIATGKTERRWVAAEKAVESIAATLDDNGTKLIVSHQSPTEVPDSWLVENGKPVKNLTSNTDFAPDLTRAQRYRFPVTRVDGVKFWVNVTLPEWHVPGNKLPAFFWFYPSEYENQAAYDTAAGPAESYGFPVAGTSPKQLILRRGYALVEPDCPIIGPRTRVNDFYIRDLRNNLSAIIDALDEKGLCDRTKLSIGGHSYGGFSTANAMVHTPYFKAGIAGAGNYNRSLTPIAFQGEQRTLFEARSTYLDMSPIFYAENLSGAMLMYAGMEDQNVGTDPVNSVRMYNVLESIGKNAALYMYPHEDHGQIAQETLQDQWARWISWLDKWVLGKTEK